MTDHPMLAPERALTVAPMWAQLIALGIKIIETRSWPPPVTVPVGSRIAIHAASSGPRHIRPSAELESVVIKQLETAGVLVRRRSGDADPGYIDMGDWWRWLDTLPRGCIVAHVTIGDVTQVIEPERNMAFFRRTIKTRQQRVGGLWRNFTDDGLGDYSVDNWCWWLADDHRLAEPIPAKGQQGLWRIPKEARTDG